MNPDNIHPSLLLGVINPNGLGAPRGTLATVEAVETSPAGDWLCTVRYHEKTQTKRGRLYRSHLWEVDLGCFEIVTVDAAAAIAIANKRATTARNAARLQLQLPFDDGDTLS
jgi:hypothetical protein